MDRLHTWVRKYMFNIRKVYKPQVKEQNIGKIILLFMENNIYMLVIKLKIGTFLVNNLHISVRVFVLTHETRR